VLIPQISDAASVLPSSRTRYVRWMVAGVGTFQQLAIALMWNVPGGVVQIAWGAASWW